MISSVRRLSLQAAVLAATLCIAPASLSAPKPPALTPMQIQAIQQREFDAKKQVVFSSVVDVLQDLGFTISSADLATGFVNAESPTSKTNSASDFFWYGGATANTRVTAFIEEMASGKTKVRLNFVSRKTRANVWTYQQENNDTALIEPRVYQATFEKVDEAVFVRRALNSPAPTAAPSSEQPGTAASQSTNPPQQ